MNTPYHENGIEFEIRLEIWLLSLAMGRIAMTNIESMDSVGSKDIPGMLPRRIYAIDEKYSIAASLNELLPQLDLTPNRMFSIGRPDAAKRKTFYPRMLAKYVLGELRFLYENRDKLDQGLNLEITFLYKRLSIEKSKISADHKYGDIELPIIEQYFNREETVFDELIKTFRVTINTIRDDIPSLKKYAKKHKETTDSDSHPHLLSRVVLDVRDLLKKQITLTRDEKLAYYRGQNGNNMQWQGVAAGLAFANTDLILTSVDAVKEALVPAHAPLSLLITGASGTGKSTCMRLLATHICEDLAFKKYEILWLQIDEEGIMEEMSKLQSDIRRGLYNRVILFIDNFSNEIPEETRSRIAKNLVRTIREHASATIRIIISAHEKSDIERFFSRGDIQDIVHKDVISEQTPDYIYKTAIHIYSQIDNGSLLSKIRLDTIPNNVRERNESNQHVKLFFLSYLLSRDTPVQLDLRNVNESLLEVLRKDLDYISNSEYGKGLRDIFLLMCFMIRHNVDSFNVYDFLKLSDIVNEEIYRVGSENEKRLTRPDLYETDKIVRELNDEHWGVLKYYLRWIYPEKKLNPDTIVSLIHPAMADLLLKAGNISVNWHKAYFHYYLSNFAQSNTASYIVRYSKKLRIAETIQEVFKLVDKLLKAGNTHHAYICILFRDPEIIEGQKSHKRTGLLGEDEGTFNCYERTVSCITEFMRITKGENIYVIPILLNWLNRSFFDYQMCEEICSKLIDAAGGGNAKLKGRLRSYLLERGKAVRSGKRTNQLIFTDNELSGNRIHLLLAKGQTNRLAELLIENIEVTKHIFSQSIIDRTLLADVIYDYLFRDKETLMKSRLSNPSNEFASVIRKVLIYASRQIDFTFLHNIILASDLSDKFIISLINACVDTPVGEDLIFKYHYSNPTNFYQVTLPKHHKGFPELTRHIRRSLTGMALAHFNLLLLGIAGSTQNLELIDENLIDNVLTQLIRKLSNDAVPYYTNIHIPIFEIENYLSHTHGNNPLYTAFWTALTDDRSIHKIDIGVLRKMQHLNRLSTDTVDLWIGKLEVLLHDKMMVSERIRHHAFCKWLFLKNQIGFTQTDEEFLSQYVLEHRTIKRGTQSSYLIAIAESHLISRVTRETIYIMLVQNNYYKKILMTFAITFYNYDGDRDPLDRVVQSTVLPDISAVPGYYNDLLEKEDQHYIHIFLVKGIADYNVWFDTAKNIINVIKTDFSTKDYFKSLPAITVKSLVLGLVNSKSEKVAGLFKELAEYVLPHAKVLLNDYRFNTIRENCVIIIYFLLTSKAVSDVFRLKICKMIHRTLSNETCNMNYPLISKICTQVLKEPNIG